MKYLTIGDYNMFGISRDFDQDGLLDIVQALPHGSGFDCNWEVYVTNNYVRFSNSYHAMDENGMYDGYADFSIMVPIIDNQLHWYSFYIVYHGKVSGYLARKHDLRTYMEDTIFYSLKEFFGE